MTHGNGGPAAVPPRIALVTPTYLPDLERCRLLVDTTDLLPAGVAHHLVVERADLDAFAPLAGGRTDIVVAEDIVPAWMAPAGDAGRNWHSMRSGPFTGWVAQQLLKLSAAAALPEDVLVFCDSDNAFLRSFDPARVLVGDGRVALPRVPMPLDEQHQRWARTAAELVGLPPSPDGVPQVTYVNNLVPWRREVAAALCRRMAEVAGTEWQEVFVRRGDVSEYMLYGTFCDLVLGFEAAGHTPFAVELMLPTWGSPIRSAGDVPEFLARLRPHHVGVMVHSKDGAPVEWYRGEVLRRARAAVGAGDRP